MSKYLIKINRVFLILVGSATLFFLSASSMAVGFSESTSKMLKEFQENKSEDPVVLNMAKMAETSNSKLLELNADGASDDDMFVFKTRRLSHEALELLEKYQNIKGQPNHPFRSKLFNQIHELLDQFKVLEQAIEKQKELSKPSVSKDLVLNCEATMQSISSLLDPETQMSLSCTSQLNNRTFKKSHNYLDLLSKVAKKSLDLVSKAEELDEEAEMKLLGAMCRVLNKKLQWIEDQKVQLSDDYLQRPQFKNIWEIQQFCLKDPILAANQAAKEGLMPLIRMLAVTHPESLRTKNPHSEDRDEFPVDVAALNGQAEVLKFLMDERFAVESIARPLVTYSLMPFASPHVSAERKKAVLALFPMAPSDLNKRHKFIEKRKDGSEVAEEASLAEIALYNGTSNDFELLKELGVRFHGNDSLVTRKLLSVAYDGLSNWPPNYKSIDFLMSELDPEELKIEFTSELWTGDPESLLVRLKVALFDQMSFDNQASSDVYESDTEEVFELAVKRFSRKSPTSRLTPRGTQIESLIQKLEEKLQSSVPAASASSYK